MTAQDWFLEAIDEVERAGAAARDALDTALAVLVAEARRPREDGASLSEIVDRFIASGGRDARMRAVEAFQEYERAMAALRAAAVRALVDREGVTRAEVARKFDISRQAVARLYEAAADPRHSRSR